MYTLSKESHVGLKYTNFILRNRPSAAAALLKGGADSNKLNKNKCSPLHVAVNKGYIDVVKTLLSYPCNANAQVCVLIFHPVLSCVLLFQELSTFISSLTWSGSGADLFPCKSSILDHNFD